jgi:hypothetical protein
MKNPWLHRYAVLVAECSALLFITGPVVTTNDQRHLYSVSQSHVWFGAAVTMLTASLVIWMWRLREPVWLRRMLWAALGASIVQDLVAFESNPIPAPVRVAHALLGELFFSAVVVVAVFTSKNWSQDPKDGEKLVENAPRLRFLTTTTASLVLLQITLGAAFRHRVIEGLPHILGALVVAVFLCLAMAVVFRTEHAKLRSAGIALTMAGCIQILLGFALLTMQSFDDLDPLVVIIATTAHLILGALTLAAAVVTAILVRQLSD